MLKLAGEFVEGQLADHMAELDAHTYNRLEKLVPGYYMLAYGMGSTASTFVMVVDRLYAVPFVAARAMTVDRIAMAVTVEGAGGTKARLGIYASGSDGQPAALVLDAGEVAVDGAGVKAITINQSLTKGLYWLACVSDGTPTVRSHYAIPTPYGIHAGWTGVISTVYVAHTYGVLPDPFGVATADTANAVYIALRLASLD